MTSTRSNLSPYMLVLPFCAGVFIAADDQTVVVTVLPEIMRDLRVGVGELDRASWAITGYLIGFTAAMPLMGRVTDRAGLRIAFLAAMAVFVIGSAAVALSPVISEWATGRPEFSWMVGARVLQAVGGGASVPIALAAVHELVEDDKRPFAYGLVGLSAEAGGVMGPLWGGAITSWLSWEWAFWLNIPPAVAMAVVVMKSRAAQGRSVIIDFPGAALFAVALALTTCALSQSGIRGMLFWWSLAGATGAASVYVVRQVTARDPLVPRQVFRRPNFVWASAGHFLVGAALIIAMVSVPLMGNTLLGDSPLTGGLRLLRMTVAVGIGALIGGAWTQRAGARAPAVVGTLLCCIAFAAMSRWTAEVSDPMMTAQLAVLGLGFGLLIAPIAQSALFNAAPGEQGAASATLTVARMLGMTVGLAALTAWGTVRFDSLVADSPAFSVDPDTQAQVLEVASVAGLTVFRGFFLAAAVVSAVCIVPILMMTAGYPRKKLRRS